MRTAVPQPTEKTHRMCCQPCVTSVSFSQTSVAHVTCHYNKGTGCLPHRLLMSDPQSRHALIHAAEQHSDTYFRATCSGTWQASLRDNSIIQCNRPYLLTTISRLCIGCGKAVFRMRMVGLDPSASRATLCLSHSVLAQHPSCDRANLSERAVSRADLKC